MAKRAPWVGLGSWPTPFYEAKKFASRHGLKALYVKREDRWHPVMAGNKVWGLEFIMGEARSKVDCHVRAEEAHHRCRTAWYARQLGFDFVAIGVPQAEAPSVQSKTMNGEQWWPKTRQNRPVPVSKAPH